MTDRLTMVTELAELAVEADARGNIAAGRVLRGVADYLMRIHADMSRIERRQEQDRRRARKKLPRGSFLREEVWARDEGCCVLCGRACRRHKNGLTDSDDDLGEIDHIRAVALGGKNELANLRLLCRGCHEPKSASDRQAASIAERL